MAQFQIGQRVKIVRGALQQDIARVRCGVTPNCVGREATIIERSPTQDWRVCIDGIGAAGTNGRPIGVWEYQIVPLTDPRAEEFMADMKRFAYLASMTPKNERV